MTRNGTFFHIADENEEAKDRKLRSLMNAIRRCRGVRKSIWQFVTLPLPGSTTMQQKVSGCPVSKAHYQKSKVEEGLKEDMHVSADKGCTLVIKTCFIRPVLTQ